MKQALLRLAPSPAILALSLISALSSGQAWANLQQITDDAGGSCESLSPAGSGLTSVLVFESLCDLTGANSDGNRELFRVDAGGGIVQLTDTVACTNANVAVSGLGASAVFDSDCDLTGANPDGNIEIFQVSDGGISQLTNSSSCTNGFPSSNDDGTAAAFESNCDLTGENGDRNSEIFMVSSTGVATQLTDDSSASFCGSFFPSIDGAGNTVAFESDCDLTGGNGDQLAEIYSVTAQGAVSRLTFGDDNCDSFLPAIDGAGARVAFESDCNLTGLNADGSVEIFTVAADLSLTQLTDDPGDTQCWSTEPAISHDGSTVAFSSFCDLTGTNVDESFEVFTISEGVIDQISDDSGCASSQPSFAADGLTVTFQSDCDLTGGNADLATEVFAHDACSCGSPVTGGGQPPMASDALFVLRAAVGQEHCSLCECDVNNSLTMTASDALLVLQSSVGQQITFDCP